MTIDLTYRSDMTVKLKKSCAEDADVIEAMLVSSEDADVIEAMLEEKTTFGRINFLMANRHGTPFEHTFFKFYMEMPIFVFREFHRHRIGWSYNEMSGRYRELPPTFYIPAQDRNLVQIGKPGHYTFEPLNDPERYEILVSLMQGSHRQAYGAYKEFIEMGIAKEVSRIVIPVGIYSAQFASCNARSLMAFLSLRTKHEGSKFPSFPQREIEMVAELMEAEFARLMPLTYRAFCDNGRVCP
jgi:thymidylate synthase (FAD)